MVFDLSRLTEIDSSIGPIITFRKHYAMSQASIFGAYLSSRELC